MWRIPPPDGRSGYGDPMPIRRSAAPLALLAALSLAGCTAPDPEPTPTVAPTTEPLFASEEEALAAAEEAYSAYVDMADLLLSESGVDPERLRPLVGDQLYERQEAGFKQAAASGLIGTGQTNFLVDRVQAVDLEASVGEQVIAAYVCRDVSGVDILDSDGNSVVSEDRVSILPVEVAWSRGSANELVVSRDDVWSGENFC